MKVVRASVFQRRSTFDVVYVVLDSYQLLKDECVQCIQTVEFQSQPGRSYYCIGTVMSSSGEGVSYEGRILVFAVTPSTPRRLQLSTILMMNGAVFDMKEYHGYLLASVNSAVRMYVYLLILLLIPYQMYMLINLWHLLPIKLKNQLI